LLRWWAERFVQSFRWDRLVVLATHIVPS
jgi:hypothetical protein